VQERFVNPNSWGYWIISSLVLKAAAIIQSLIKLDGMINIILSLPLLKANLMLKRSVTGFTQHMVKV